jgi:hypothetical protein
VELIILESLTNKADLYSNREEIWHYHGRALDTSVIYFIENTDDFVTTQTLAVHKGNYYLKIFISHTWPQLPVCSSLETTRI